MNPFAQMLKDAVFIEQPDGSRSTEYKTAIGSKNGLSATIFESALDVEEGWKLIRPLPNKKEEVYTILEANYSPGLHSIPAHWTLKLKKDSSMLGQQRTMQATTININNSHGIQIGDHNVQHIANGLMGLAEKIESSNTSVQEKQEAKGKLRELISNPIVAAVLGGAAQGIFQLLGN